MAFLADLVLFTHLLIVIFVIGGLVVTLVGNLWQWSWVNGLWFRLTHIGAIAIIVAEVWFGVTCPFTTLEMSLRKRAGEAAYGGGFVEHWLHRLLYYDAPEWVFTLAYSAFGLLTLIVWWRWPPRLRRSIMEESGFS